MVDVEEHDTDVVVSAELPGLDEKDIEVLLQDGVLTLRGEKKGGSPDSNRQFHERFFGRFERRIPLDADVEADKASVVQERRPHRDAAEGPRGPGTRDPGDERLVTHR